MWEQEFPKYYCYGGLKAIFKLIIVTTETLPNSIETKTCNSLYAHRNVSRLLPRHELD